MLILGSMPGKASLLAGQYYAHPRNLFWPMMEWLYGIDSQAPYLVRCAELKRHGLALWDVLKSCTRSSSLDSDIVENSIVTNDLAGLLDTHPQLQKICFNGAKAMTAYERYVGRGLSSRYPNLQLLRLPSTSPANAAIALETKRTQWRAALQGGYP